ncbi:MAG: hypothetical protein ACO1SV_14865 [Fimbriimonas sp.]
MPLLPQVGPPPNPIRLLAPSQLRVEAELIRVAVETLHPGVNAYLSKGGLVGRGKELDREAGYAGDTATWFRGVSRYLATLRSQETYAEWPEAVLKWRRETPTHLPFRIRLDGKRAIVTQAAEDAGVEVGDELQELEGRRVDDIRRAIAEWTSIDGRTEYAKSTQFRTTLDTYGPVLWGLRTTWRAKFRKAGAKEIKGIPFAAWQALDPPKALKDAVTFERLGGKVAVLRVTSVDAKPEEVDAVLKPYFAQLSRDPGTRLVLDLRRFEGRSDTVPTALMPYLGPQPTAWATEVWLKAGEVPALLRPQVTGLEIPDAKQLERREDGTQRLLPEAWPESWRAKEPVAERFDGPLDVLVGRETGPEGTTFLTRLRAARTMRVVGEATAGAVDGSSGGAFWTLRLPHSRLTVRFPLYRRETGVKERRGLGVLPDVRKGPTREDREGKGDSVLDWVLANPVEEKRPKSN